MKRRLTCRGAVISVQFERHEDRIDGSIDGRSLSVSCLQASATELLMTTDGKQQRLFVAQRRDGTIFVHMNGDVFAFAPVREEYEGLDSDASRQSDGRLVAAMPSKVIKLLVTKGDTVKQGQSVLILESMKMETTQEAPFDGEVVEVNAEPGQQVDAGDLIVRLEQTETDA